jgi:hypothetical protein
MKTNFQRKLDLLSFRSAITHSLAQNLLFDAKYDKYTYLNQWAKLLMNGHKYDVHETSEVILYALHHAEEEVLVIKDMQSRGIKINVQGHGGSAIKPEVLAELAVTKSE